MYIYTKTYHTMYCTRTPYAVSVYKFMCSANTRTYTGYTRTVRAKYYTYSYTVGKSMGTQEKWKIQISKYELYLS